MPTLADYEMVDKLCPFIRDAPFPMDAFRSHGDIILSLVRTYEIEHGETTGYVQFEKAIQDAVGDAIVAPYGRDAQFMKTELGENVLGFKDNSRFVAYKHTNSQCDQCFNFGIAIIDDKGNLLGKNELGIGECTSHYPFF